MLREATRLQGEQPGTGPGAAGSARAPPLKSPQRTGWQTLRRLVPGPLYLDSGVSDMRNQPPTCSIPCENGVLPSQGTGERQKSWVWSLLLKKANKTSMGPISSVNNFLPDPTSLQTSSCRALSPPHLQQARLPARPHHAGLLLCGWGPLKKSNGAQSQAEPSEFFFIFEVIYRLIN